MEVGEFSKIYICRTQIFVSWKKYNQIKVSSCNSTLLITVIFLKDKRILNSIPSFKESESVFFVGVIQNTLVFSPQIYILK